MATLAVNRIVKTGLLHAVAAAGATGDAWLNTGKEYLEVVNGSANPITVTIAAQRACNFGSTYSAHNISVTVDNATTKLIGPVDPATYNDANGLAQIAYTAYASVTVGVFAAP